MDNGFPPCAIWSKKKRPKKWKEVDRNMFTVYALRLVFFGQESCKGFLKYITTKHRHKNLTFDLKKMLEINFVVTELTISLFVSFVVKTCSCVIVKL